MDKSSRELYQGIGNRIRELRMKRGYTLEQLAEKVDISIKYLYQIESGEVSFSTGILLKICKALHIKADVLLTEEF